VIINRIMLIKLWEMDLNWIFSLMAKFPFLARYAVTNPRIRITDKRCLGLTIGLTIPGRINSGTIVKK